MIQGDFENSLVADIENDVTEFANQYKRFSQLYKSECDIYRAMLQAPCRLSVPMTEAEILAYVAAPAGTTPQYTLTEIYRRAIEILNPFTDTQPPFIGQLYQNDDLVHMRQLWVDNQSNPNFQVFNAGCTSVESVIFNLDKEILRAHQRDYARSFALALDQPVFQRVIINREFYYQAAITASKVFPDNDIILRYVSDQILSKVSSKLLTELQYQAIKYPRYIPVIKAFNDYIVNIFTDTTATIVDYSAIEDSLIPITIPNAAEDDKVLLIRDDELLAGVLRRRLYSQQISNALYHRIYPVIIHDPVVDNVFEHPRGNQIGKRQYIHRLLIDMPKDYITAGTNFSKDQRSIRKHFDSDFVIINNRVDDTINVHQPNTVNTIATDSISVQMIAEAYKYITKSTGTKADIDDNYNNIMANSNQLFGQFQNNLVSFINDSHFLLDVNQFKNVFVVQLEDMSTEFPILSQDYYSNLYISIPRMFRQLSYIYIQRHNYQNKYPARLGDSFVQIQPDIHQLVNSKTNPPMSTPESIQHFQDIYSKQFKESLYSVTVEYILDGNKYLLRFTNIRENQGDPLETHESILHQIAPHTYGVIDYILLPSGRSVSINYRVNTITLIQQGIQILAEYPQAITNRYYGAGSTLRSVYQKKLLEVEGPKFFNKAGNAVPCAELRNYDASKDLIQAPNPPIQSGVYLENEGILCIQGFVQQTIKINTSLVFQVGGGADLTVDDKFEQNYSLLKAIYVSRSCPTFDFYTTCQNSRAFLKHLYADIRQIMHLIPNSNDLKPKRDFDSEFMSIYPADLKVPIAKPVDVAKKSYKDATDLIYKEVEQYGGNYQWKKWDCWQNFILNSHSHLQPVKALFYQVSSLSTLEHSIILVYLRILIETNPLQIKQLIQRANTTDPQLRLLLRHVGEMLCKIMHSFYTTVNGGVTDQVELTGGSQVIFGRHYFNAGIQKEANDLRAKLTNYNQTYKESFPPASPASLANYQTAMSETFSTSDLDIVLRSPSLMDIRRYSDTAFSSIPVFDNTTPIVMDQQVGGEGYRILVFPPAAIPTQLYKYYKKGPFTQVGSGADTKTVGTYEYKALYCVLHIPVDSTLRTLPNADMFVLEDLSTLPTGGSPVSLLPGLSWRNASAQNTVTLRAIVLKFEGSPPPPPAPLLPFDTTKVIPKTFNTLPNTQTIADIQKYISDQASTGLAVVTVGFSSQFKDSSNVSVSDRPDDYSIDDMFHFVKAAVQNQFDALPDPLAIPAVKREKLVIINSVPKQLKTYHAVQSVIIKQFLVYQVLKYYYNEPAGKPSVQRLHDAYLKLESAINADIDKMAAGTTPLVLFEEKRIKEAIQRLVTASVAGAKNKVVGYLDDLKTTVFREDTLDLEDHPADFKNTTFLFVE